MSADSLPSSSQPAPGADCADKAPLNAAYRNASLPLDQRVEDLLARMTLEEKLGQLNQQLFQSHETAEQWVEKVRAATVGSFYTQQTGPTLHNQLQKVAIEESRLGIPLSFGTDIIHGCRVIFPVSLGLSCGWEPGLLERSQSVAAREARQCGVAWIFAPMCDLARDARWGRVVETCGEDPWLNSICVAAQVRGFQGENPAAPDRVAACLKHFVAYGAVAGGRDYNHTEVPESILRQSHLPPFFAGVEAGALTVMSSFNTIDGIPAAANRHVLTEILRNEWGFAGAVISDWEAIGEMVKWGFARDQAEAARLGIEAGNDVEMLGGHYSRTLAAEVEAGRVAEGTIDTAVRRLLLVKFLTGLFDHPLTDESTNLFDAPIAESDLALARECVIRSAVLLKNEKALLPLSKNLKNVALIGPFGADRLEMLGAWKGLGCVEDVVTLAEGIAAKLSGPDILRCVVGCPINTILRTKTLVDGRIVADEDAQHVPDLLELDEATQAATKADVVIMALGEPCGWTGECGSRASLGFTGHQQQLFDAVAATGKKIVTVVFSGRPLALPAVLEKSAAVLFAWQPGIQAGNGIADLLFGDAAPSGRLTISVPRDVCQVPVYYNRYKTGRPFSSATDYRDFPRDPQFWFGYGLTFTTFEYGVVEIQPATEGNAAVARATITNTGKRAGHEVAQLYIRQLACSHAVRPEQELRGFQRIALDPGETTDVSFQLTSEVLGFWARDGKWHAEVGDYHLWIAPQAQIGEPTTFTFKSHH
ncbi:MAG: glycoside hydrolase family 3 N-terminal domain-containing protein [Terrimicrobiaceae bacterium]